VCGVCLHGAGEATGPLAWVSPAAGRPAYMHAPPALQRNIALQLAQLTFCYSVACASTHEANGCALPQCPQSPDPAQRGRLGHAPAGSLLPALLARFADTVALNSALGIGNSCWGIAMLSRAGVLAPAGDSAGARRGVPPALVAATFCAGAARLLQLLQSHRNGAPELVSPGSGFSTPLRSLGLLGRSRSSHSVHSLCPIAWEVCCPLSLIRHKSQA
jgi:hypothetical protein